MKSIKKSSELLWAFGIVFVALGVAICNKANLGVSMIAAPAFVLSEALEPHFPIFSVGVTEYIIQGIILLALCVVIRKFHWRFILAFGVAVIYGYTLNFFIWLLNDIELESMTIRWIMLITGDIITAFGVACFFRTYLPLQVYELFVAEIAKNFGFKINRVKSVFDISLLLLSVTLALTLFGGFNSFDASTIGYSSFHSIGLGTLVTTLINSPLITVMGKLIDIIFDPTPRFRIIEFLLKH